MKKVGKILNVIVKILTIIVLGATAVLSLTMAYIMFAPDTFPKPFHLAYAGMGMTGEGNATEQQVNNTGFLPPPTPEPTPVPPPTLHPGEGIMAEMSTKIVNLADPAGRKYIRVTLVLEFYPNNLDYFTMEEEARREWLSEFDAEIQARMPLMDDIVISLLSVKSYEELYTADGKEFLRSQIMDQINERLPEFYVMSVYFTEFVVQ
jgi:flagellar FliL protein